MMQYILLAYRDEKRWAAMSASERASFEAACQSREQELIHSLHLIDVKNLENNTALTVRIVDGEVSLTDRPVAGSEEQLIQLLFIQAMDLNAAIQIALKMPHTRGGPIEVKSIVE
jgi:hypothetical protein